MARKIAGAVVLLTLVIGLAPSPGATAATPQIVDPALDHPVPFADLVGVELSVVAKKSKSYLQVVFTTSGEISDASRNLMTGYIFRAKVGSCDLLVGWNAFPMVTEPAGIPAGSAGSFCGATGKDYGGTFTFKGNSVTVQMPMQDVAGKGLVKGATMTNLSAQTALLVGLAGDDTGVLSMTGDTAASTKSWVVG